MSLTSLLKTNSDFGELLRKAMPSKEYWVSNTAYPAFAEDAPKLAEFILTENWMASLVGLATDYLFRFMTASVIQNNKEQSYTDLVAEHGLSILKDYQEFAWCVAAQNFDGFILKAKQYTEGDNSQFSYLLYGSVFFALLEEIARAGPSETLVNSLSQPPNERVLKDILNVTKVFKASFIDSGLVRKDSDVVFNPRFGEMSLLCGGADADIFIDGILYDFKCTRYGGYAWYEPAQVYGYYLLNELCKRFECSEYASLYEKEIIGIGIYQSRHGLINTCLFADSDADNSNSVLDSLYNILKTSKKGDL